MSAPANNLAAIQQAIWRGTLPLEIRLSPAQSRSFDATEPYFVNAPRQSYLPFLLRRLHAFFAPSLIDDDPPPHQGWFSFEGVPLKWHYPVGFLYDMFSGARPATHNGLTAVADDDDDDEGNREGEEEEEEDETTRPWCLTVHFGEWPSSSLVPCDAEFLALRDAFVNSVKEADVVRYGNARGIMGLSKTDSDQLWRAVGENDFRSFDDINQKLMNPPAAKLKNIPIKIYLPSSGVTAGEAEVAPGSLRVVQSLVPPALSPSEPQTVGTTLHHLLPSLFPTRRSEVLAKAVLHGAVLPLAADLEGLLRHAAYADGWIHLGIFMMG